MYCSKIESLICFFHDVFRHRFSDGKFHNFFQGVDIIALWVCTYFVHNSACARRGESLAVLGNSPDCAQCTYTLDQIHESLSSSREPKRSGVWISQSRSQKDGSVQKVWWDASTIRSEKTSRHGCVKTGITEIR